MDRRITYPAQIPVVEDLLGSQRYTHEAVGRLAGGLFGESSTGASGLACTPGSGLSVVIAPGQIVAPGVVDATGYGTLPASNSPLPRQYSVTDPATLEVPAAGQTWVVYGTPQTSDINPLTLPFYNAANPSQTFAGQDNSGSPLPTVRSDSISLSMGLQVPGGAVPLWQVTVPSGATSITQSMIAPAPGAPFWPSLAATFPRTIAPYSASLAQAMGGYPINAIVADPAQAGLYYQSTEAQNLAVPGQGSAWVAPFTGRILKKTAYPSGSTVTWVPDPRTQIVIVELQGAGGAGGGCATTGSDQQAVAWGGTAGTYVRSGLIPANVFGNSQTVTVGTGGAPQAGADGGNGGTSSFGSLLSAPGGAGGSLGRANAVTSAIGQDGAISPAATGSVDIAVQARGSGGSGPIALGTQQSTRGGSGGRAHLGPGGAGGLGTGVAPIAGVGGGGGGGQAVGSQSSQSTTGAYGGDGVVIVWEYQ